jgi:hypothetical protein
VHAVVPAAVAVAGTARPASKGIIIEDNIAVKSKTTLVAEMWDVEG